MGNEQSSNYSRYPSNSNTNSEVLHSKNKLKDNMTIKTGFSKNDASTQFMSNLGIFKPNNSSKSVNVSKKHKQLFEWKGMCNSALLIGSFSDWKKFYQMSFSANLGFRTEIELPSGTYHYKFIIDGKETIDKNMPYVNLKDKGDVNVLTIKSSYAFESLKDFDFRCPPSVPIEYKYKEKDIRYNGIHL